MTLPAGTTDDYGNPLLHNQVMTTKGIYVDCGLKELLEALWAHDYPTVYSCQGGTEIAREAYIVFPTLDYALRFVGDSLVRGVPGRYPTFDKTNTGEFMVRWSSEVTDEITKAWTDEPA